MNEAFQRALHQTLLAEGGYQNARNDPGNTAPHGIGGGTNFGVTQATYDAYMDALDLPFKPVRFIKPSEVRAIYEQNYWRLAGCPALLEAGRPLLAQCAFDWAVHGGVKKARVFVQAAVRAFPDGVWGPRTLDAFSNVTDEDAASSLLRLRAAHHWVRTRDDAFARAALSTAGIPQMKGVWPQYSESARPWLKGWLTRIRQYATALALPVHPAFAHGAEDGTFPHP